MKRTEKIDALKKLKAFVKSEKLKYGLCNSILWLGIRDLITPEQRTYLESVVPKRRPVRYNMFSYCWEPGVKKPRIDFINKKLKELEERT